MKRMFSVTLPLVAGAMLLFPLLATEASAKSAAGVNGVSVNKFKASCKAGGGSSMESTNSDTGKTVTVACMSKNSNTLTLCDVSDQRTTNCHQGRTPPRSTHYADNSGATGSGNDAGGGNGGGRPDSAGGAGGSPSSASSNTGNGGIN